MNKSTHLLELEGYEEITYTDMLEKIVAGEEIVLTSKDSKLYWRPRRPCHHDNDTNIQRN